MKHILHAQQSTERSLESLIDSIQLVLLRTNTTIHNIYYYVQTHPLYYYVCTICQTPQESQNASLPQGGQRNTNHRLLIIITIIIKIITITSTSLTTYVDPAPEYHTGTQRQELTLEGRARGANTANCRLYTIYLPTETLNYTVTKVAQSLQYYYHKHVMYYVWK